MGINLQEGTEYKYADVRNLIGGGSPRFYLPFKRQTVFAAFLKREKNPNLYKSTNENDPDVILVGTKPRVQRAGAIFLRQNTPVPVFMKKASNRWRYSGLFLSSGVASEAKTAALARIANRRDVAFAITLRKAETSAMSPPSAFMEGECGQVTRNEYERNSEARAICLHHHGYRCCVCSLLFEEEYGDRGINFIHVHHLEPLSTRKGPSPTDPRKDLVPVCANCHSMLHMGGKLIAPKTLRELYWSAKSRAARNVRLSAKMTNTD